MTSGYLGESIQLELVYREKEEGALGNLVKRLNGRREVGCILICITAILFIILNKNGDKPINILDHMENGMDDPAMTAYYQQEISDVEDLTNGTIDIWYYPMDLNSDGREDRIVIISSPLHSGSSGDYLEILLNNGTSYVKGSVGLTVRLLRQSQKYVPVGGIYILQSRHEGFCDIEVQSEDAFLLVYREGSYRMEQNGMNEKISVSSSGNPSSWEGTYHFNEFYRDPSDPDGPFLAMDYDLRIYSENGKYFAEVEIDGQTTWIHVLAQVYGNEEGIDLMYLEGVEEAPFPHIEMEPGTVLLSLREEDGLIYTYWGAITAYIYDSNQRSGKVYFTKMEEAEIDPSDGKALSVMGASLEIPCWRLEELRMNDSGLLSRWSQDEVDTVLNALEGYWMADEYAGFVLPEFYFTHLAETDGLSDEKRMQVYEEKIDEAKNHIPEWHFSIRQNNTGENTVKNCVYIDGQEEQEIDLFLCMSREEDSYPEYVDRTAVSGEVDIVYPVLYMEFRVPEDGVEKQVNLIITADNRLYLLIEGAFYTVKEIYG